MNTKLSTTVVLVLTHFLMSCGINNSSELASSDFGQYDDRTYSYHDDVRTDSYWRYGAGFQPQSKAVIFSELDPFEAASWSWNVDSTIRPACGTADYLGNKFGDHGQLGRPGGPIFATSCQDVHRRVISVNSRYLAISRAEQTAFRTAGYSKVRIEVTLDFSGVSTRADRMNGTGIQPYHGKNILYSDISLSGGSGLTTLAYSVRMDTDWHAETAVATFDIPLGGQMLHDRNLFITMSGTMIQFNQLRVRILRAF